VAAVRATTLLYNFFLHLFFEFSQKKKSLNCHSHKEMEAIGQQRKAGGNNTQFYWSGFVHFSV